MICGLHARCRFSSFSIVNHVTSQTPPCAHIRSIRVQFIANECLKMAKLLEGLMQNTIFPPVHICTKANAVSALSFPISPKLLRSPTCQKERERQRECVREKVHQESMLLRAFKRYKSYFVSVLKYAQYYQYKFWINANVSIWVLLQMMNPDVLIFLYFFVLGLLWKC